MNLHWDMSFKTLMAYQKAFGLAMQVFDLSKSFPKSETYALTDQIRRSSRSVCAQIAEAYRKKRYPNYFISKLTDADAENSETQVWLDFALSCQYLEQERHKELQEQAEEVGKLIAFMINNPGRFGADGK